jgi:hypothetical protein
MSQIVDLPLTFLEKEVGVTEKHLQDWEEAPKEESAAISAEDRFMAELLVDQCFRTIERARKLWDYYWNRAKEDQVGDFDRVGELLDEVFDRCSKVAADIASGVRTKANAHGVEISRLVELETEAPSFQAWARKVQAVWPRPSRFRPAFDPAELAQGRQDVANGNYEPIKDILDRVKAGGSVVKE